MSTEGFLRRRNPDAYRLGETRFWGLKTITLGGEIADLHMFDSRIFVDNEAFVGFVSHPAYRKVA